MPARHVIVDGSNLATEGRSLPSLAQLDQAVREFLSENPDVQVTVVVDASFGHRINPSEVATFEEAEAAGELVSPPAGAIGRGDAFLLRIAEKTGATVLSNDSFQEFHGEHAWLFDDGRLIGGKPVPGVGWIFMPRSPVRGQRSREVVKEAKRKKRADDATFGFGTAGVSAGGAAAPASPVSGSGLDLAAARSKGRPKKMDRAIARATEEAVEPKSAGRRRRRTSGLPPAEPVNEPLVFITFIAAHPLGSEVTGTVAEFSSHGAFVDVDGARCYLPLSAMGDPPPRRAREVVSRGEERRFVIQALDPQRRGIELALPGFARVAGGPTEETVEAEIHPKAAASKHRRGLKAAPPVPVGSAGGPAGVPARVPAGAAGGPARVPAGAAGGPAGVSDGKLPEVPAMTPDAKAEVESEGVGATATAGAKKTGVKKAVAGPKRVATGAKKAAVTKTAATKAATGARKTAAGVKKTAKAVAAPATKPAPASKKAAAPAKGRAPSKAAEAAKVLPRDGTALKQAAPAKKRAAPAEQAVKSTKARPAAKAAAADQTRSRPSKEKTPAKTAGAVKKVPAARAERT
jgi:hypothetical protein